MPTRRSIAGATAAVVLAVAVRPLMTRVFDEGRVCARPFVPPDVCPADAQELLDRLRPTLDVCKDRENGELPAKWLHAVENFVPSIGVAIELG